MNDFSTWFLIGMAHITDLKGYDHILFLLALCGVYEWKQWKNLLVLITAFTIGHSVSLALSVLQIVQANSDWVEFLIPVTIVITCAYNLTRLDVHKHSNFQLTYFLALFFGIIHGLGFSTLLKSLLGNEHYIAMPLLAFNVGLEAGQILIVFLVLLISVLLTAVMPVQRRNWNFFLSSAVFGIAFLMALERLALFI